MEIWDYFSLFVLLLYTPLGVFILLLRIAIFVHINVVSCILHSCYTVKRCVLYVMKLTLGFWIETTGSPTNEEIPAIIVSNHMTVFDHLMLHICCECITPHSHVFHWYASYLDPKSPKSGKAWAVPVHLFTENSPSETDSDIAALRVKLLESCNSVQPVALEAYSPLVHTWVPSRMHWIPQFVLLLFLPFTRYSLRFLEPINRESPNETDKDFMERVTSKINATLKQTCAATSLVRSGLNLDVTVADKAALMGGSNLGLTPSTSTDGPAFQHLIPAVKEVLEDVPEARISAALAASGGDVDWAIDFLLNEREHVVDKQVAVGDQKLLPTSQLNTSAEVFHSTSADRQRSLQDRRQALLAYARRRHLAVQSES